MSCAYNYVRSDGPAYTTVNRGCKSSPEAATADEWQADIKVLCCWLKLITQA